MEDKMIIDLFNLRSQEAITRTKEKYGGLCQAMASRLLSSREDAEECVNDTYLALWDAIPPASPASLGAYAVRITRNLAMKRLTYLTAEKRSAEAAVSFEELEGCIAGNGGPEDAAHEQLLKEALRNFLGSLDERSRWLFLRRYYFFDTPAALAQQLGVAEGTVRSRLHRIRMKLKKYLIKEGIIDEW